MGKGFKGNKGGKKFDKNDRRGQRPGRDEGLTFSLREQVKDATDGKVFGPPCICCNEPIDVTTNRKNGNVTQGWAHEACMPWAEQLQRQNAAAEDEAVELEKELASMLGVKV